MYRPAGMSSDEEEFECEDNYISLDLFGKRHPGSDERQSGNEDSLLQGVACKETIFMKAAEACNFDLMRDMIAKGVPVDWSENGEWTAMMNACSRGKVDMVRFLLDTGADANAHVDLFTPLMSCCSFSFVPEEERLECVRLLLEAGANVNASDRHKSTALILSVTNGLEMIATELIHVPGVNINWKDKEDWTVGLDDEEWKDLHGNHHLFIFIGLTQALMYAVKHNRVTLVEKLVRAGAKIHEVCRRTSYTALSIAERGKNAEILRILNPEYIPDEEENDGGMYVALDPMEELLDQLPDEKGSGGFSNDVRNIFAALELDRLYDKIKPNISLPEFLLMEDLSLIGVKLEPVRRKISHRGIHRFFLHPWRKGVLHNIPEIETLRLEDYVNFIGNITKQLTIICTTLEYVRRRSRIRGRQQTNLTEMDKSENAEVVNCLVDAYVQVKVLSKNIQAIAGLIDQIPEIGDKEADYVGREESSEAEVGSEKSMRFACVALGAAVVLVISALFHR